MGVVNVHKRFDILLVSLDSTEGFEKQKTRPCVVISPDEMNRHIQTVIVAPMTTSCRAYPSRVPVKFKGKVGEIALDQIRTVDRKRVVKHFGVLDSGSAEKTLDLLVEMFSK